MKSFKQFIITKADIDSITYGTPTVQQQERMDKELEYFDDSIYDLVTMGCPPSNTSDATKNELYYLHRVEKDEEKFKEYDLHFSPSLFDYARDNGLEYNYDQLRKIKREASNILLHSKFHFNRPRPYQLADAYGMELEHMNTESGHTPAYPSGHAAQSRLVALLIARDNPDHKDELLEIADDIALSRELGGVHYPSDNDFGKEIADIMYEELTGECPCCIGESVITEARGHGNIKGFINSKSGEVIKWTPMRQIRPFHSEYAASKPGELGSGFKRDFDALPTDVKTSYMVALKDRGKEMEQLLRKHNWISFLANDTDGAPSYYFGGGPWFAPDKKEIAKAMRLFDKKIGIRTFGHPDALLEISDKQGEKDIWGDEDIQEFMKTAKIPVPKRRTDIGQTMAMFRGEEDMKSFGEYIKESQLEEAEYQGKKVTLNKPFRTPGESKKFAVYTKNDRDKVVIVRFGDPNMEIKRDDPKRRANFRSRHNCDNPGPKWKARYWSCYQWRAGAKVDD